MLRRPVPINVAKSSKALLEAARRFTGRTLDPGMFIGFAPIDAVDSTYAVDATSREFVGARGDRQYLFIANMGANPIRVSFGKPATATTGMLIQANGYFEPLRPLSTSVNAISVLGSTILIVEG